MTFVNEKELKNQNKLIKNYLDNRKLFKAKHSKRNFAKKQLQQSTSDLFHPITKTFQETQKKTAKKQDKMLQNIEKQLANTQLAIKNIPQLSSKNIPQLGSKNIPQARYSVYFDEFFNDEEKQLLSKNNFEVNLTNLVQGGRDDINKF